MLKALDGIQEQVTGCDGVLTAQGSRAVFSTCFLSITFKRHSTQTSFLVPYPHPHPHIESPLVISALRQRTEGPVVQVDPVDQVLQHSVKVTMYVTRLLKLSYNEVENVP